MATKKYLLLILAFNLSIVVFSQKTDSIAVETAYLHPVNEGEISDAYKVISQATFDNKGKMIRKLWFDIDKGQLKNYNFYWYANGILVKMESYSSTDSMLMSKTYKNNASGLEINHLCYSTSTALEPDSSIFTSYNDKNNIETQTKHIKGVKKPWKSIYKYNSNNQLVSITSSGIPEKNRKKLKTLSNYFYYPNGKLQAIKTENKSKELKIKYIEESYAYNDKGLISEVSKAVNGKPISKSVYEYFPDNRLRFIKVVDEKKSVISFTRYEYTNKVIDLGLNKNYNKIFK